MPPLRDFCFKLCAEASFKQKILQRKVKKPQAKKLRITFFIIFEDFNGEGLPLRRFFGGCVA